MEIHGGTPVIPLLGMHRSGTSALAGALHKLGADLGPESSWLHPAADNPLGFFEYQAVVDINRDVLAALGGTWSSPPPLPPGWVDDERLRDHRERARQLAAELPANMVVKDPRLSLTQPLWDEVSAPQPALLCVRHPGAVAGSLNKRNELTMEQGLYLWFRYNAASMMCRPDALVIEYERLLADPEAELRRAAAHIGLEVSDATVAAASHSLHGSMSHHDGNHLPPSPVSEICEALHEAIGEGRPLEDLPGVWLWARLAAALPWATESEQEVARAQQASKNAERENERLQVENRRIGARAERLESELRHTLAIVDAVTVVGVADLIERTEGGAS
jgi:hypothetical protein